jgi:hypothetical protein
MTPFGKDFNKFADIFFNGRPAEPDSKVTIQELVRRGESLVRVGKKLYRVRVKEVEVTK